METVKKVVVILILVGAILFAGARYYKNQWTPHVATRIEQGETYKKFKMDWCEVTVYVDYDIPRMPNMFYLPSGRFAGTKKVIDYKCPLNSVERTTKMARDYMNTEAGKALLKRLLAEQK
jgi:hypothetical protein